MKFTWDEHKRIVNLHEHQLDFCKVNEVFEGFTISREDVSRRYTERRYLTVGRLGRIVVVIAHTDREETIHVISFRKATRREANAYFSVLYRSNGLAES